MRTGCVVPQSDQEKLPGGEMFSLVLGTWGLLYPCSKLPSCTSFAGNRYPLSNQYLLLDRNVSVWFCLFSALENT